MSNCVHKGIDVSEFQGEIDWDTLAPQIDFAMIRAGYGQNNADGQFARNMAECARLGIPCGVYWFSYALNAEMAAKEAEYCLDAIAPYKLAYPVAFDFEYDSVNYAKRCGVPVTKALASGMVRAFCTAIENGGHYAVNYTNQDFLSRYFDSALLERFDLWLASWPESPDFEAPPRACGMWQWGGESYDGVTGEVDSDVVYKDYPSIII